ncbi:sarcosine oxidase subunit beta [Faunimonas pinastri]|uniref:Sarcosine oxidase subunit beta n=1 Tax=Faunimonas pinastri TaxID=1855383 RepID=A0A1H9E7T5_9HYPH|nr:FAD-binding oxidoreductase [Faunimonas pinastri]SEQ21313.1 sarcosine oxidase subunit beta [Faunimonas pinastri]
MSSVIVIGGGVIGASIAYHLARDGAAVTLVDRCVPASMPSASWASAGGLRSQGRHAAEHAITLAASRRWATLEGELDAWLEVSRGGHLHVAETESEAAALDERIAHDRAGGIAAERIEGGAALGKVVPGLAPTVLLGEFTPADGQAHPARTARAFARAAVRLGATCQFADEIRLSEIEGRIGCVTASGDILRADHVVLAAGAWSVSLLTSIGIELPIRWRGLQMLLSDVAPPLLTPTLTAMGRNLSLKRSPSGQMMVGGRWFARPAAPASSSEPSVEVIDAHVARQWSSAVALLPAMASLKLAQCWAGAEAQTLDSMPLIGSAGPEGLYLATGFSNHGFQISPEIGRLVAADLLRGPEPVLAPFSPSRFDADVDVVAGFRAEPILL